MRNKILQRHVHPEKINNLQTVHVSFLLLSTLHYHHHICFNILDKITFMDIIVVFQIVQFSEHMTITVKWIWNDLVWAEQMLPSIWELYCFYSKTIYLKIFCFLFHSSRKTCLKIVWVGNHLILLSSCLLSMLLVIPNFCTLVPYFYVVSSCSFHVVNELHQNIFQKVWLTLFIIPT